MNYTYDLQESYKTHQKKDRIEREEKIKRKIKELDAQKNKKFELTPKIMSEFKVPAHLKVIHAYIKEIMSQFNLDASTAWVNYAVTYCTQDGSPFSKTRLTEYITDNIQKCHKSGESNYKAKSSFMTHKLKEYLEQVSHPPEHTHKIRNNDVTENDYYIIKRKIDDWLMYDIKNAPRDDMKLAFMEAVEFIRENEDNRYVQDDLSARCIDRIKKNKADKKRKLDLEIDYVIDNVRNAQEAYYIDYLLRDSDVTEEEKKAKLMKQKLAKMKDKNDKEYNDNDSDHSRLNRAKEHKRKMLNSRDRRRVVYLTDFMSNKELLSEKI